MRKLTVEAGQSESVERIVVGAPNNSTDICSPVRQKMVDYVFRRRVRGTSQKKRKWRRGVGDENPSSGSGKEDVCTWFGALACHLPASRKHLSH